MKRKTELLDAGLRVCKTKHYSKVTRDDVARAVGAAPPLLNYYFGTMERFKRALVRHAVKQEDFKVIAQGLADGNRDVRKAPKELLVKVLAHLS